MVFSEVGIEIDTGLLRFGLFLGGRKQLENLLGNCELGENFSGSVV